MADPLALRAAKYFGVQDEPRTSISVGRQECVIVLRRSPKGATLAYYSEEYKTTGHYIWLTNHKLDALREALDALGSPPSPSSHVPKED